MMLESGDWLFFDITPTGTALQMLEGCKKEKDDTDGPNRGDCDTVLLHGREVARLMWTLHQAMRGIAPLNTEIVHEKLTVGYTGGLFSLSGCGNTCVLKRHEMYMMLCAFIARAWRMFA